MGEAQINFLRAELAKNQDVFESLTERLECKWSSFHPNRILSVIQVAANHAWHQHPGVFTDSTLECIATAISRELRIEHPLAIALQGDVHVITRARTTGGHTRLLLRWLHCNSETPQNVIMTRQMGAVVPRPIQEAVAKTGGRLIDLQSIDRTLLGRAQALLSSE